MLEERNEIEGSRHRLRYLKTKCKIRCCEKFISVNTWLIFIFQKNSENLHATHLKYGYATRTAK